MFRVYGLGLGLRVWFNECQGESVGLGFRVLGFSLKNVKASLCVPFIFDQTLGNWRVSRTGCATYGL